MFHYSHIKMVFCLSVTFFVNIFMRWSTHTWYAIKKCLNLLVIKHEKSEWGPLVCSRLVASHNEQIRKPETVCVIRCVLTLRCTIKVNERFFSKLHFDKMIQSVHIGVATLACILGLSITLAQIPRPGQLDHFLPPPPSRFNVNERQQPQSRRPSGQDLLLR